MTIIEDTRQQAGKHEKIHKYFEENNIKLIRSKLLVGDYARIDNMSVVIDTKKDLLELFGNLTKDHARVREDYITAKEAGVQLIILVENENNIKNLDDLKGEVEVKTKKFTKILNGDTLRKIAKTMQEKYAVQFLFTTPEKCPEKILEILGKI